MKFAQQISTDGSKCIVDANGKPLSNGDVDYPILHVLPKLFLPSALVRNGVTCDDVELRITSSLPNIEPEGGIIIRQPLPNQRYVVGGSSLIRYGWIVPLPLDVTEFDIEFHWFLDCPQMWKILPQDSWHVRHLMHIKLQPGAGLTYTMDGSCWPQLDGPAMHFSPRTFFGASDSELDDQDRAHRNIVKEASLVYGDKSLDGDAGYFLEENVSITGIPFDKVWSLDAFQDEQLHEVKQGLSFSNNEAHRANANIEMPLEVFYQAVLLAEATPFDNESDFGRSVEGVIGGMERHPAMLHLCEWWESVRPEGQPFKAGAAMPLVRVQDDGEYWFGYYETPNATVDGFDDGGLNSARIGDFMLILFIATNEVSKYEDFGTTIFLPSGAEYMTVGAEKKDCDEAWYCLEALTSFRSRFPAAWGFIEDSCIDNFNPHDNEPDAKHWPSDVDTVEVACPWCKQPTQSFIGVVKEMKAAGRDDDCRSCGRTIIVEAFEDGVIAVKAEVDIY